MKRRYLFGFLLGLLACVCAAAFVACDNGSDPETPGDPVTYTITGAEDVYLKLSDAEYDFAEGVSVSASDGSAATLSVDDSAVNFGTAGAYDVVYSCGEQSVTVKAYVFALPVIADSEEGGITSEYAEVQANLYKGLTATDSLGSSLEIAVVEGTENPLYDERGIPQYGEHSVTYSATDRVGQTATYTRSFEVVVGEDTPVVTNESASADVADDTAVIAVDLKGQPLSALYIGDVQMSDFDVQEGTVRISVAQLAERYAVGKYDATLMTGGGYADFTFLLTDVKPMALDWFGLDNWVYTAGAENCAFPVPEKLAPRQDIAFGYALKSVGGGTVLSSENGSFTAPAQAGEYTLTVTYSRGQDSDTKDLSVYILTEAEAAATLARGDSLQNPDELPFCYKAEESNASLLDGMGYTEDEGVGPAYKLSGKAKNGDQSFAFVLSGSADSFGGSDIDDKYNTVWIDIYYAEDSTGYPWLKLESGLNASDGYIKTSVTNRPTSGYDNILDTAKVRVYSIEADGSTGDYAAPQAGVWLRYAISLEDYRSAATPFLWIGNEYGGTFYVRHVMLSEESIGEDLPLLNNGFSSSIGLNYDAPNLQVTDITEETIGGRDVVSLTHDWTLNVNNSKNDLRSLALSFGILMEGRIQNAVIPDGYETFTFEFYAEEGADLWFYFGHDGSFVLESAKTSDVFCVYDESGNRIAVPVEDGWCSAEVSLDTARACTTYVHLGIIDNTAGHKIAVDPLTIFYRTEEFIPAPTPDLPVVYNGTNNAIAPYYDTVLYGGSGYSFSENQTVDGRSGAVTLQTITNPGTGSDRRNRAVGFGALADNGGTTDASVPDLYNTLAFDLYAEEGASVSVLFGHASALGGFIIVDLSVGSAVRAYSLETGEYLTVLPADTWVHVVVDLTLYRACLPVNGGSYGRLAVCNNVAGTSISIDPSSVVYSVNEAEKATLALADNGEYGNVGRYFEMVFYREEGVAYNYTDNANAAGRTGVVTLETLMSISSGNDRRQLAIGFGCLAQAKEPNDSVTESGVPEGYTKLVLDICPSAGAALSVLYGYDGSYIVRDIQESGKTYAKFYAIGENGARGEELADFVPDGTWVRMEIELSEYWRCLKASNGMGRIAVCNGAAGTSIAIDPASVYYTTESF